MSDVNVEEFNIEKECIFDGERYSVRDNGAVLRHPQPQGRKRATDNQHIIYRNDLEISKETNFSCIYMAIWWTLALIG